MALTKAEYQLLQEKANKKITKTPVQHESKLQMACVEWFRLCYPDLLLFSVPNGGSRNKIEAKRLQKEGVLAGVSDLILLYPSGVYHGLCIEMKYKNNTQSENQKIFEKKVNSFGYKYLVVNSFEVFRKVVTQYINVKI